MRNINEVIVHCSATREGRHHTVEEIRSWHKQRGWSDIGYHYVVYLDGTVHNGRPVEKKGAHVSGRNANTIGVCYVGGVDENQKAKDTRTPQQRDGLERLLKELVGRFPGVRKITGHNQYANKACPCFNAERAYAHIVGSSGAVAVDDGIIRRGDSGDEVSDLQLDLAKLGYLGGADVDGIFGGMTEAAVKDFQRDAGLAADGIVGPNTQAALAESL